MQTDTRQNKKSYVEKVQGDLSKLRTFDLCTPLNMLPNIQLFIVIVPSGVTLRYTDSFNYKSLYHELILLITVKFLP